MNRRKFVTKASTVALGLGIPAFALAKMTTAPLLNQKEEQLLNEFRQLLASYSHGAAYCGNLSTVKKINSSLPDLLDFQDTNGNRISLRKVKGRLVAKLH